MTTQSEVSYRRTYFIQAAHFNDGDVYDQHADVLRMRKEGRYEEALAHALDIIRSKMHGHNFLIEVLVETTPEQLTDPPWLVDDARLEATVMAWNNINLSLLPEFEGKRATTERMAALLCDRVLALVPMASCTVAVAVRETESITATHRSARCWSGTEVPASH